VKAGAKSQTTKSQAESFDEAINELVKGLKRDIEKKYGRVDYVQLHHDGYSEFLLIKLKQV
jgi:hypothetical protein